MIEPLKHAALQAQRWLLALPTSVRATAGMVLFALAIAVMVLSRSQPPERYEFLLTGRSLNKAELSEIEAAFAAAQLQEYMIENGRIRIPASQRAAYLQAIADRKALPHGFYAPADEAIEGSSPIELSSSRDQRFKHAREKQAALAVRSIPGIEDAFVLFDETERRGFRGDREFTALVGVFSAEDQPLDPATLQTIRDMVLGFKAGLHAEHVTVTDIRSRRTLRGNDHDVLQSWSATYGWWKQSLQREWTDRIKTVLAFIPGAQVAVHVQLQPNSSPAAASVPPAASEFQGDANLAEPAGGDGPVSLGPPHISISIGVPASYLRRVVLGRQDAARNLQLATARELGQVEEETRQKIQSAILPLLPGPTVDPSQITITTFEDPSLVDQPIARRGPRAWLAGNWQLAALFATATAVAAILLGFRHSARHLTETPRERRFQVVREGGSNLSPVPPADGPLGSSDAELRDRLSSLVQGDPDAAAQTLSKWIDKAS